jgi:hypothetical protein
LIVNYHTKRRRGLVGVILRMLGEPDQSSWTPGEMAEDLRVAGFDIAEDSGIADWAARFAAERVDSQRFREMRIVVAHRRSPARADER